MPKAEAVALLTAPVSQADMIAYTDMFYIDLTDGAASGLQNHYEQVNVHGLPDLTTQWAVLVRQVYDVLNTKTYIQDTGLDYKMDVAGTTVTGTVEMQGLGKQLILDSPASYEKAIISSTDDNLRWALILGDDTEEQDSQPT